MGVARGVRVPRRCRVALGARRMTLEDAAEVVESVRRDNPVPRGSVLLTGTGIVPPDDFTLKAGDEIGIEIATIGTLRNVVG